MKTQLDHALHYREELGFSIIPIKKGGKSPIVSSWVQYQREKPTVEQIKQWWATWPDANIAIICGEISKIAVVDIDDPELYKTSGVHLPATASVSTSKGTHNYYRLPKDNKVTSYKLEHGGKPYGDFQAEGKYVVAPQSIHETGKQYEWITGLPESVAELDMLPEHFIKSEKEYINGPKDYESTLAGPVQDGGRNTPMTSLIGKLLHDIHPNDWEDIAWPSVEALDNQNNKPPIGTHDLRKTFDSISKKELANQAAGIGLTSVHAKKEFDISNNKEMYAIEISQQKYVVDKLVPKGAITAITADSGKGKSLFMLIMARYIALGEPFLGEFETGKSKVLIIDQEMDKDLLAERYKQIIPKDCDVDMMYEQNFKITDEQSREWLISHIKDNEYGVIIFDTLITIHDLDENNNSEMSQLSDNMLDVQRATGCTLIYLHHHKKLSRGEKHSQASSRGSTEIMAKMASHLLLESKRIIDGDGKTITSMTIKQEKSRRPEAINMIGIDVEYNPSDKSVLWTYQGEIDEGKLTIDKAKDEILALFRLNHQSDGLSINEINEKIDTGKNNIRNACKALVMLDNLSTKINVRDYKANAKVYYLTESGKRC